MFEAAMKQCDDCYRTDLPLAWWGPHIRICPACRAVRDQRGDQPQPLEPGQIDVRRAYP